MTIDTGHLWAFATEPDEHEPEIQRARNSARTGRCMVCHNRHCQGEEASCLPSLLHDLRFEAARHGALSAGTLGPLLHEAAALIDLLGAALQAAEMRAGMPHSVEAESGVRLRTIADRATGCASPRARSSPTVQRDTPEVDREEIRRRVLRRYTGNSGQDLSGFAMYELPMALELWREEAGRRVG